MKTSLSLEKYPGFKNGINFIKLNTMTEESMTQRILGNFKSIKQLINSYEGLSKKIKRMSEEIDSLKRENKLQEREIKLLKSMIIQEF